MKVTQERATKELRYAIRIWAPYIDLEGRRILMAFLEQEHPKPKEFTGANDNEPPAK